MPGHEGGSRRGDTEMARSQNRLLSRCGAGFCKPIFTLPIRRSGWWMREYEVNTERCHLNRHIVDQRCQMIEYYRHSGFMFCVFGDIIN